MEEVTGRKPAIVVHVDNQAALALSDGSKGSWRTRHLRLRMSWLRERIANGEAKLVYEPGLTQRADLGTKPLAKDRLQHLVGLWGFKDASPSVKTLHASTSGAPSMKSSSPPTTMEKQSGSTGLASWLGQLCGTKAQEEGDIVAMVHGSTMRNMGESLGSTYKLEFYTMVAIVAVIAIGVWEFSRRCMTPRIARLQVLQEQAARELERPRLSTQEMDEFRGLLERPPGSLSLEQAERLVDLRARFGAGGHLRRRPQVPQQPTAASPESTSGRPPTMTTSSGLTPYGDEVPRANTSTTHGAQLPSASSTGMSEGRASISVVTSHAATQTDAPNFMLMDGPPTHQTVQLQEVIPEGPYYHVPHRGHVHLVRDCSLMMCQCCLHNDGRCMYGPTAGQKARG